jgi:hypothetical protein
MLKRQLIFFINNLNYGNEKKDFKQKRQGRR